jgi:tripartite-type tricarboxylate transporter receptor subunit TctC
MRKFLLALAWAAALTPAAQAARPYPGDQPIRLIVPFGVGGLADISMRLVAQKMGERFDEKIIIDNRPGAGGIVAATAVLNAPKDGHTLAVFANGTAISKSLFTLPFDPEKDFTPISTVAYFDLLLLTNPKGKIHTLADLLEEGKKRQLTLGTINPGSTQNLSAELFRSTAKLNAIVVPFKTTADVTAALVRGDVDVAFESYAALKGPIDGGMVMPIAATGSKRSPWLPKVPTAKESGLPTYEVTGWNALFAPAGTPPEAIETIHRQLAEVLKMPELRKRFEDLGTEAQISTPEEMGAILHRDVALWADVIKQAGIPRQ